MPINKTLLEGAIKLCAELTTPDLSPDPMDFLTCAAWESGLKTTALNVSSRAAGLIQWMPANLNAMGLTTDAVLKMDVVAQLKLCRLWFWPRRAQLVNHVAWYLAIFSPAFMSNAGDPDWVVFAKAGPRASWYFQNKQLDFDSDGVVTVGDMSSTLLKNLARFPTLEDELKAVKVGVAVSQAMLTSLRFGQLKADGVSGPKTAAAISAFQKSLGDPETGQLAAAQRDELQRRYWAQWP